MSVAWVSIASLNYIDRARVLAESLASHVPGARLQLLLCDESPTGKLAAKEPFDLLTLRHVARMPAEGADVTDKYLQRAVLLKPFALQHLLDNGTETVVFLDPDMLVTEDMSGLVAHAEQAPIALSPHMLYPTSGPDRQERELAILQVGVFNGGLITVSNCPEARRFLCWWSERLTARCAHDVPHGVYYDQRWLDFAPSLFSVQVFRDPVYNAAYWNVDERNYKEQDGRYLIDNEPLRLFHFSGFNPNAPETLSCYLSQDDERNEKTRQICTEYAELLKRAGRL